MPPSNSPESHDAAETLDIEARELRTGDELFGAGIIGTVITLTRPGPSVVVGVRNGHVTLDPDEIVTVRRG